MMSNNTITKLHEMKLSVMAKTFRDQLTDSNFNDLSFEERFGFRNVLEPVMNVVGLIYNCGESGRTEYHLYYISIPAEPLEDIAGRMPRGMYGDRAASSTAVSTADGSVVSSCGLPLAAAIASSRDLLSSSASRKSAALCASRAARNISFLSFRKASSQPLI